MPVTIASNKSSFENYPLQLPGPSLKNLSQVLFSKVIWEVGEEKGGDVPRDLGGGGGALATSIS